MTGSSAVVDTNIFIDLMKGDAGIAKELESFTAVYVSPIVLAELYFGAFRSASPEKHLSKIAAAIQKTRLLPIGAKTSEIFVTIKIALFAKGKPIPENDIWIAASALQYDLPLYTNDNHFLEIEKLQMI